jgi:hypothetical protein
VLPASPFNSREPSLVDETEHEPEQSSPPPPTPKKCFLCDFVECDCQQEAEKALEMNYDDLCEKIKLVYV